jgi:hypothetical protein
VVKNGAKIPPFHRLRRATSKIVEKSFEKPLDKIEKV